MLIVKEGIEFLSV